MDASPPSTPPPHPPTPPLPPGTPPGGMLPPDPMDDDDAYRPIQAPPTGGVIALGILNIVFALICGCTHGSGAAMLGEIENADADVFTGSDFDRRLDEQFAPEIAKAEDEEQKRALESLRDYLKSPEFKEAASEAITYMGTSETGQRLKMATTAGVIAQVLMLLSGALLLARMRVARPLALVATFATIAVQIGWLVFALEAVEDVELRILERIDEAVAERGEKPAENDVERAFQEAMSEDFGDAFRGVTMVGTGLAIIYPLIAFLVILLSRNIRRALDDDPPVAAKPDIF